MEEKKTKTNGKRNRAAGHNLERDVVIKFKDCGFEHVVTSRSGNRLRDAEGIDLVHNDELKNGRFPFNVQCKNYSSSLKYWELLNRLPKLQGVINVVIHKFTKKKVNKSGVGVFHPVGHYAIVDLDDFISLVKAARANSNNDTTT